MNTMQLFKRDVLLSIRPFYASKILEGEKTVELRRRFPETDAIGATALIYASSPVRAIVGYAQITEVQKLPIPKIWKNHGSSACINKGDFDDYFEGIDLGFAIFLKNPQKLDHQLSVEALHDEFGFVPPQSFRYLDNQYKSLLKNERNQTPHRHQCCNRA